MSNEPINLTEQDLADIEQMHAEEAYNPAEREPLLVIWEDLLSHIDTERHAKITLPIAQKTVSRWPQLSYADMPRYHELYFEYLNQMRQPVLDALSADPESREVPGNEDAETNRKHYLEILFEWNALASLWQFQWETTDPEAAIKIAAMIDANGFFLSQTGLVAHFHEIGLRLTEEEQQAMADRVMAYEESLLQGADGE